MNCFFQKQNMEKGIRNFAGRAEWNDPERIFHPRQLAFDRAKRASITGSEK
jgi:hypothetical protein